MADILNKIETGEQGGQLGTVLNDHQVQEGILARLLPRLVAYGDAQKTVLKDNEGTRVKWLGFRSLSDNESEATEGVTPEAEALDPYETDVEVKQYVRGIKLTDRLLKHGKVKCQAVAIKLLGESGAKTIDTLIYKNLMNQTFKVYGAAGKGVALTVADNEVTSVAASPTNGITGTSYLVESDLEKAFVYLRDKDIPTFDDGFYHAFITPKIASDIRGFTKFVDKSKYQDPTGKGIIKGEIGTLMGIKFIETTNIPKTIIDSNEYENIFVYGSDAYGVIDVENGQGKPKSISKGLGSAGTDDFADQRASEAIKFEFATKVICDPKASEADPLDQRILRIIAPAKIKIK